MSDLTTLHDAWPAPEAPSHAAYIQARAALLDRAAGGRASAPRHPRRMRLTAAGAVALAIACGVTVVAQLAGTGDDGRSSPVLPGVSVASADVLERAAVAAEDKPFTAPRDDQWIYFEERFTTSEGGGTDTRRTWRRADGGGIARIDEEGKLRVSSIEPPKARPGRPAPELFEGYKAVAALPADPAALLRWAYERARNGTGGGMDDDGDVYLIFNHILRENVLPPELEAAIFRALKQIPGVTVETADAAGRPALALGLQTAGWLHEELLLDEETYAYLGERSTVVEDAVIDPLKAGNATGAVTRGSQVVVTRVVTAIVDEPGRRR